MASHADILDQPEHLFKPFWGSLFLHISLAAVLLGYGWIHKGSIVKWGDPGGGGIGAVAVAVNTIKLPPKSGPENPVANDTESHVPAPPPKAKPQPKVKTPPPDAIPLKSSSTTKKRPETASSQPNKWREQQQDSPNQNYSTGGQSVSSRMYNMMGGGGVGIGTDSPLGTQFGWYATLLRNQVSQHWKTGDVDAHLQSAPGVVVSFTLLRDGSVPSGSVRVLESSGNRALDFSAQRAILDAVPFPHLPDQFNQNQANIELRFELKR